MAARLRLDQALVNRKLCESREQARRAIMAGAVRVNGNPAVKPGDRILGRDQIELLAGEKYVSRGGLKLERALDDFHLEPDGWTAIDLGASTGGFTDCLLQRGAARVYAVDVGQGQLAWKLRQDPRVVVMEKTNARHLTADRFPQPFRPVDLLVVDCSFISLRTVLPPAIPLLRKEGYVVALIKPQFEAGKKEADRGRGVISDPEVHRRVIDGLRAFFSEETPLVWRCLTESPIQGAAGNREFLVLLEKKKSSS
jgi:23S rRNA (cytidine1920-2'-O)/16S rRNA (cytidine1409-2'-O)-methyltransferase